MRSIKYFFGLLFLFLFVPSVDALSYDVKTEVFGTGNKYELKLSLVDVKDTDYGIVGCTMGIVLGDGTDLNSSIKSVGNWNLESGDIYLFDTANPVKVNTPFAILPVTVRSDSFVTLSNITCVDDDVEHSIGDKKIDLKYQDVNSNNNNSSSNSNNSNNNVTGNDSNSGGNITNSNEDIDVSNCDLQDIILSDGEIDFNSNVTEYEIYVDDIDLLEVEPKLSDDNSEYSISKTDNQVVILVTAKDGTNKIYTLNVVSGTDSNDDGKKDNKYVPVFILIICILVLINIIRIVKNLRSKS